MIQYAVALLAIGIGCGIAQNTGVNETHTSMNPFEPVRVFIRKRLTETQVPSIAVAVARGGKIIWEEGFGWADRERRIPATEHTLYSLASVTKPITATGLMILKERHLLDLDRPLNEYLGDAKLKAWIGDAREATVRRVANHTSGLPLHFQFFFEDEPERPPSMDETILRYGNLVTRPGEVFTYSNLGYGLLGYLISRLAGKSYADFLKSEVFLPLGMTHSCVDLEPALAPFAAARYGTDGRPLPFYTFDHPGASAVFSSAHDLVRFGLFHVKAHLPDQKAILSDGAISEMQHPMGSRPPDDVYGIGWFLGRTRTGEESIAHGGGMDGVSTRLYLVPKDQVVIVVLSNADSELPGEVFREIMPVLYGDAAREHPSAPPLQAPATASFHPPAELVGTWTGFIHTYKGGVPLTLWVHEDGDIHSRAGNSLETVVNEPAITTNLLTGRMVGDVGTEDAARLPYDLHLSLRLRPGGVLNGVVTARSLPGKRLGNALSYWAQLTHSPRLNLSR